ncbi:hypothetical protein ACA910_017993 [Epithemia clementina (nom. ined.)]
MSSSMGDEKEEKGLIIMKASDTDLLPISSSEEASGPQCVLDPNMLTPETLPQMTSIGLSIFASACGKNRGAFVVDPPDGHTYSCLSFPSDLAKAVQGWEGVRQDVAVKTVNDIQQQYQAGNLTSSQTLAILDWLVQNFYSSSPNKRFSPYTCDFNGLTTLTMCSGEPPGLVPPTKADPTTPIRAVTMAGVFVPAPTWLLPPHVDSISVAEATSLYTSLDFEEMVQIGINTVLIPVPAALSDNTEIALALSDMLATIQKAGLQVILELASGPDASTEAVAATAAWAAAKGRVIMGLTIPKTKTRSMTKSMITAIRKQESAASLPLLVPIYESDLSTWDIRSDTEDDQVYGALEWSHTATVADIASSTSAEDRAKLFYHEAVSCIQRAPLEFSSCFYSLPVLVSSGFDLAIDNCIERDEKGEAFLDFGQCGRFHETTSSRWWKAHRQSFAARQMYAFERGMGWSFATWKLLDGEASKGYLKYPAQLLSLKDVLAAGLFPQITSEDDDGPPTYGNACLNTPLNDFAMGDATLAPSPAPPPDCGNGWWNFTTKQCDYWIPPPPTFPPTCEVCTCDSTDEGLEFDNDTTVAALASTTTTSWGSNVVPMAAVGGAVVALVLGAVAYQLWRRKRQGYSTLPTN